MYSVPFVNYITTHLIRTLIVRLLGVKSMTLVEPVTNLWQACTMILCSVIRLVSLVPREEPGYEAKASKRLVTTVLYSCQSSWVWEWG